MQSIKLRKGYTLKILGAPSNELIRLAPPDKVAVTTWGMPFVKPRLKVQIGDRVALGTVLFEDRRRPEIKFLAPGGGKVAAVNYGPRRVLQEIVIALDPKEELIDFGVIDE